MATYETPLIEAGLSKEQAIIYEWMVRHGTNPASKIARETGIPRTFTYKLLDELERLKLVSKYDEPNAISQFTAEHPFALRTLIDTKREETENAHRALESALSNLVSDFTAQSGQPGIRIIEGKEGITELYEDILNEGQDLLLIRSPEDDQNPELYELVATQIRHQVRHQIHTRAITPFVDETKEEVAGDEKSLVTRRLVFTATLNPPAQILIYANKVAITAYGTPLMTTIIENTAIKNTFTMLFEFLWKGLEDEDKKIRTGLTEGTLRPSRQPREWVASQNSPEEPPQSA